MLVADTGVKQSQFCTPPTFHRGRCILCSGTNNSKAEQSRQEKILLEEEEILFHKRLIKRPCKDTKTYQPTQERILFLPQPQTFLGESTSQSKPPSLRLFSTKATVESWRSYSFSAAASIGVCGAAARFWSRRDLESVTIATPVKISAAATACVTVSTAKPSKMLTKAATMGCT